MAAVNVTNDAVTWNHSNGGRTEVRNSAGIAYKVAIDEDNSAVDIFKADAASPTGFTAQDTTNNPASGVYGSASIAIDSDDIIHGVYMEDDGKTSACRYFTFDADAGGAADTYLTDVDIDADIGSDPGSLAVLYCAIAIDANDIPHVAYTRYDSNMGTDYQTVTYNNRIGGAWNGGGTEIEGVTAEKQCQYYDIAIDADNLPCISYYNATDDDIGTAQGTANDASTFTLNDVETNAENLPVGTMASIVVDSSGNHWVAYLEETSRQIYIIKHNYGDAWTTWQTRTQVSGEANVVGVSLVANGTDLYVFYEDLNNDISYYYNTGSGWTDGGALETGTFNTAKAKWAFWVDNDSGGNDLGHRLYYFDGSDAAASDPDAAWTDETNADDGDYSTIATTTTSGSSSSNYLQIEGTNAPASGINISTVYFQAYDFNGAGGEGYVELTAPGGSWTWAKIQALEIRAWKSGSNETTVTVYADGDAGGTSLGSSAYFSASTVQLPRIDILVINSATRSELDYTFADEVSGEEDIWWNTLALAATDIDISVNDAITVTEDVAITNTQLGDISVFDAIALTEDVNITLVHTVSVFDAIALVEDVNTALINDISVFDAITLTESVNITRVNDISVFDAITTIEDVTITNTELGGINVFDAVVVDENINIIVIFNISTIDAITVTEDITITNTQLGGISVFDAIALTEDVNVNLISDIFVSDTITVAEDVNIVLIDDINVFDAVSLSEDITVVVEVAQATLDVSVFDAITLAEDVNTTLVHTINVNDAISVFDFPGYQPELILVGEFVTVEVTAISTELSISVFDAITLTENIVLTLINDINVNDAVTINENVNITLINDISVFDAITLTESVNATLVHTLSVFDAITVNENIVLTLINDINVFDAVTLIENVNIAMIHNVSVFDTVTLTENITITNTQLGGIDVFDAITVSEDVIVTIGFSISIFDQVMVDENITITNTALGDVDVFDNIAVTENIETALENFVNIFDAIAVTENVETALENYINVFDNIALIEDVNLNLINNIDINDTISLTENIISNTELAGVSVFDAITVDESVTVAFQFYLISVSDTITISENTSVQLVSNFEIQDAITIPVARDDIEQFRATINNFGSPPSYRD